MAHLRTMPRGESAPVTVTRLVVLPHAGGSGAYYRRWGRWLPDTVEVVGLDLPGHATRMSEPLATQWAPLVADLTEQLRARTGNGRDPYVLAGHSLGALLAYDLARTMAEAGRPPRLLLVCGRNGPAAGLSHRPIHHLPDERFLTALEQLAGAPEDEPLQPELRALYLPILRADVRLAETWARRPGPPLPVPVAAFGGREDRMTDERGLVAWSRETTGTFGLTLVEGGHFFHGAPSFRTAVRNCLAALDPGEELRRQEVLPTGINQR